MPPRLGESLGEAATMAQIGQMCVCVCVYSYTASKWTADGYAALSYRHTEPEGTSQRRGFEGKESLVASVREGAMYVL